nr:SDR family NAD(P)-dependent oxidoreductase [Caballeronia sp. AZ7_KS35]
MQSKVAPVTGAASGIGLAISQMLVAGGARVVLADRDEAALTTVCKQLGTAAIPLSVDLLDTSACAALVSRTLEATFRALQIQGLAKT